MKKIVAVTLVALIVVGFPYKFGTKTRGNQFKKGTKAEATLVVGAEFFIPPAKEVK